MNEWYYIGNYGQLGPLSRDQVEDLVDGGVIEKETFVWREGMMDWLPASEVSELRERLSTTARVGPPPVPGSSPVPPTSPKSPPPAPKAFAADPYPMRSRQEIEKGTLYHDWLSRAPMSDKSRILAGILNFLPGFGRIYLGYGAHGILQLILAPCAFGWLWSIVDGLLILGGGVKFDGYGRRLKD